MLNDPLKPSGSEQEKKKLCIVCSGPNVDDCEVFILDLESDLKDYEQVNEEDHVDEEEQVDDDEQVDEEEQVNFDEQVDDSADLVVLTPIARLAYNLIGISTFCVLGSKLYMFEDGHNGTDDRYSIVIVDYLKSAYAYDFSSSSSSEVVKLDYNSVHKIKDMHGPKARTLAAAPIPDGKIIVVFSSEIQYDPCDDDNHIKRIDFELYDAGLDEWFILPGLAELVAEKAGRLESNYEFSIGAFFFVTNSVMLVLISGYGYWFSLELDDKHKGVWRDVDQGDGVFANLGGYPVCEEEPQCIVFGGRMCVSSISVFDIQTGNIFHLPYMGFVKRSIFFASAHVTLLSGVSGGECKFARVYMGTCSKTDLSHLVVDVFTFNLDTYIKDTGPTDDKCLKIQFVKTSEFILGNREHPYFGGYIVSTIIAGINVTSNPPKL